ncbi:MAG: UDP-2,3-diacylglucosamine diphosphatase, partial [Candidatus Zixiibacteriota bacterium]
QDLFIADAHLRHPDDRNYRRLLEFLTGKIGQIRTLYLLGDIFEFCLGYRHVVYVAHVPLFCCLERLRQTGTKIVYVEGNHDFNLGPFFARDIGCTVLPQGGMVEIDGQSVFLTHGDLSDASDRRYRLLRSFFRSGLIRFLSGWIHPDRIRSIGDWSGKNSASKKRPARPVSEVKTILLDSANRAFAAGAQVMVVGHYHTPLYEKTENGTLIALGDWIENSSYAVYENGIFRLDEYQPTH